MANINHDEMQKREQIEQQLEQLVNDQPLFTDRLDIDGSEYKLTSEEVQARKKWNKERKNFVKANKESVWFLNSQEALVSSAIVPPEYSTTDITSEEATPTSQQRSSSEAAATIMKKNNEALKDTASTHVPFKLGMISRIISSAYNSMKAQRSRWRQFVVP